MVKQSSRIGFIGGGNMGEAIVGAIIKSHITSSSRISVSDVSAKRLDFLEKTYGIVTTSSNFEVFINSDIVILAIKPQQMNQVLTELSGHPDYTVSDRKLVISIAAGVPLRKIEDLLYHSLDNAQVSQLPVIRVMPNTPALVLCGMSGMSPNQYANEDDIAATRTILNAMGRVIEFPEKDLDAVTALSGSGPAYVFYLIESMIAAGISLDLKPEDAETLTLTTLKGAVKLMEEKGRAPEDLRRQVTSPGGTTEAAVTVFEARHVKQSIIEGIVAAAKRSKELSQ